MNPSIKTIALSLSLVFSLISCSEHAQFARVGRNGTNPPSISTEQNGIVTDAWVQSLIVSSNAPQVDLLFVLDTSDSMLNDITAIKKALDGLVSDLVGKGVDLCAAVMLAAPTTEVRWDWRNGVYLSNPSAYSGVLLSYDGTDASKVVCVNTDGQEQFLNKVKQNLDFYDASDPANAGKPAIYALNNTINEAGLLSFKNLLTNASHMDEATRLGFLRPQALLSFVVAADEDDLSNPDINNGGGIEYELYKANYKDAAGNFFGPQEIFNDISEFQGINGLFSAAIIHRAGDTAMEDGYPVELEVGEHYEKFVNYTKGEAISMSLTDNQSDFNQAFHALSDPIFKSAVFRTVFSLSKKACPNSIAVKVDGVLVPTLSYDDAKQNVRIASADAGQEGSDIQIAYIPFPLSGNCP